MMKKRSIAFLLMIALAIGFAIPVHAQTQVIALETGYQLQEITPDGTVVTEYMTIMASTLIKSTSLSCEKLGSGKVRAGAAVVALRTVDELWITSLKIQEKRSGSWVTVKSTSNVKKEDSSVHSASIEYQGAAGKEYRSVASYKVVDGSKSDTRTDKTAGPIIAS